MKRPRFITVRWLDHHRSPETWAAPTPPAELRGAQVESRGWLIGESDEVIELSAHKPLDGCADWGTPMRIVKAAIHFRSDRKAAKVPTVPGGG